MILEALKKAGLDLWEELLLLALFNIIWCLGTVLIVPWPAVTFGLFYTVRDVGEGKAIKFTTFFEHVRRTWKPAYLWGGVNLAVWLLVALNLRFYASIAAQWAATMQVVMIALLVVWTVLQIVVLPIYPRLAEPGLKLALQNALVVIGRYPLALIALLVMILIVLVTAAFFPPFGLIMAVALVAILANRMVDEAINRELKRES